MAGLTRISAQPESRNLRSGIAEYRFQGQFSDDQSLSLEMIFRVSQGCPVLRFRYVLHSTGGHVITKGGNVVPLRYIRLPFEKMRRVEEIRVSFFNDMLHSYTADE